MSRFTRPWRRLRNFFFRDRIDAEMSDEMRHHLDLQTAEHIAAGLSPSAARFAALRQFGHVEGIKETARDQRGLRWLGNIFQDLRYGARMLRKNPGFTTVTVLTLALGIGATAAIFTVVNSVVLQPLPYHNSGELLALRETFKSQPPHRFIGASRITLREWLTQSTSFASIATATNWPRTITDQGAPVRYYAWRVSPNFFSTLGVQPILGRAFRPDENIAGHSEVLVISHRLWRGRFNGRSDIIGLQVHIDDQPYTIIGVLPKDFLPEPVVDPAFFAPDPDPVASTDPKLPPRYVEVNARLKPGVTAFQAEQELIAISARTAKLFPETNADWSARVSPLLEARIADAKPFLLLLLAAVGFLLLIACVNVANLLLARASTRTREIAVRCALGASRSRIISQLLCESLLISLLGSAFGIALAYAGLPLLLDFAPLSLPRAHEIAIDGRVLGFSCALAIFTGLGFGLAPALQASRVDPQQALKEQGRGTSAGGRALRLRRLLVAFEVALALVLLMAAGLVIRSFAALQQVPLGFQTHTAYLAKNTLPPKHYPTPQSQDLFVQRAMEKFAAIPGVHSVVFSSHYPAFGRNDRLYRLDRHPELDPRNLPPAACFISTPSLFRALDIALVQGRLLDTRDDARAAPVAVVSRSFADKYFPGENPLGQSLTVVGPGAVSRVIVGVVGDIRDTGPLTERPFQIYLPFSQAPLPNPSLLLRVDGPSAGLEPALRRAMDSVDANLPVSLVPQLDYTDFLHETYAPQRFALFLFVTFASVALLLSALGIYGIVAYSVTQRTQEIGIRLALGAQARDILRMIFSQTGRMVGAGIFVGLIASFLTTRFLKNLLFGIGEHDLVAFLAVPLFLGLIAWLACWLPARRATKVDPLVALRTE